MKFFKIYFFILINTIFATVSITTNEYVFPVENLNELKGENKITFLGFTGQKNFYKKTNLYTITKNNELKKTPEFNFSFPEESTKHFISAHKGSFTKKEVTELVVVATDPVLGCSVYLWEITEEQQLERKIDGYIINEEQPASQPTAVQIKKFNSNEKHDLVIAFGSPNRHVAVIDFSGDKPNTTKLGTEQLNNQAGNILLGEGTTSEIEILTNNSTKEIYSFKKNRETTKKKQPTPGIIKQFFKTDTGNFLLTQNNKIIKTKTQETIELKQPTKAILEINEKHITLLMNNGEILQINKENSLLIEENPPSNKKIQRVSYLYQNQHDYILSLEEQQKNTLLFSQKEKNKKEEITRADTLYLTAGSQHTIPIYINENLEFIGLETTKQPEKMSINLNKMNFIWTPDQNQAGYNQIEYNISYKAGSKIEEVSDNGKININKIEDKKTKKIKQTIFVNVAPEIFVSEKNHTVQANHTIEIPLEIRDLNAEQILSLYTDSPEKEKINIENRKLSWQPDKSNHGKNFINAIVSDGILEDTTEIIITVDTVRQTIIIDQEYILTENEEFILNIKKDNVSNYVLKEAPENMRVSSQGNLQWIPIATQLGPHNITIELIKEKETEILSLSAFVNAVPVISLRPENIEYVTLNDSFYFNMKSFDANINQNIYWGLETSPPTMKLTKEGYLSFDAEEVDYHKYVVVLSDSIDENIFFGQLYVNDVPKITNEPPAHIQIDEKFNFPIVVDDLNEKDPYDQTKQNRHTIQIIEGPQAMEIKETSLVWQPTEKDAGTHNVELLVSDGLVEIKENFTIYVNDTPKIISSDSLTILVGDTLKHFIAAQDQNTHTDLTYSIRTSIEKMLLNAKTGELIWIPKTEDIGTHFVDVAVSDGFDMSADAQQIKIVVLGYPEFITTPPTEAYVNLEYQYLIKAQNATGGSIPKEDFFVKIQKTTLSNLEIDTTNYIIISTPSIEDIGNHSITLLLSDQHKTSIEKQFPVLVLGSTPCETEETIEEKKPKRKKYEKKKPPLFKIPYGENPQAK